MMISGTGNGLFDLKKRKRGFSLVEILLVVVLMGILTTFAVTNFHGSFKRLKLKNAADKIAGLMRYAQSRSIVQKRQMRLVFDEQLKSCRLLESEPISIEAWEPGPFKELGNRWGKTIKMNQEIVIKFDGSVVTFSPDGKIKGQDITVCLDGSYDEALSDCLVISTKQQGFIDVYPL